MRNRMMLIVLLLAGCESMDGGASVTVGLAGGMTAEVLSERVAQFEPATIDFDDGVLEPWEKAVLAKLIDASQVMHEIFLAQVSPRNSDWSNALASLEGEAGEAARAYFDIMAGPWDRLDHDAPFLNVGPKPAGAGYYPEDLTKEEFDRWLAEHPSDRQAFEDYFTVIRRSGEGLIAEPYASAYGAALERAASLLLEAAELSQNASLSDYLHKRAAAFRSNDYFESDLAWMDLDSRVEPTIGPYEVYEDGLLGYKAAFESFVTVADEAASAELQMLKDWLPQLEARLPIEERHRNPNRAFQSPIRVVDEVFAAGDTRAGVQTTAFNLPNDVRVHEQKGSKKVMLRNVSRAKFQTILEPIAHTLLAPELSGQVAFQPWFTNVVMHELAHGLGPGTITLATGETTTVNRALREHYSPLEELKADVTGLHNLSVLAGEGLYTDEFLRAAWTGHLADLFRAVRFGTGEAHGRANLVQFNWLREKGAFVPVESRDAPPQPGAQPGGTYRADLDAVIEANRALATEVLTIQATGDYERAAAFLARYAVVPAELEAALARLSALPVDIRPRFTVLEKRTGWGS